MSDLCHLCFEKNHQLIHNIANNSSKHDGIQQIILQFFQFIFQQDSNCTLTSVCINCWQKLSHFYDFCERIRNIHQSLIEVGPEFCKIEVPSASEDDNKDDIVNLEEVDVDENDSSEYLDSANDDTVDICGPLEAEPPANFSGDREFGPYSRKLNIRPDTIRKLELQLQIETSKIKSQLDESDYERIEGFIKMECAVCNEPFHSFTQSHTHFLNVHKRCAYWTCCKLVLETPYDLLDHIRYHERIDAFQCAACNKCFLTSNKLKYHIRRSHLQTDDPLTCELCGKSFRNQRTLLSHQKSHIKMNCPHCEKVISIANYDQHVRSVHVEAIAEVEPPPTIRRPVSTYSSNKKRNKPESDSKEVTQTEKKARRNQNNLVLRKVILRKNNPVKSIVSIEPNENGMFECDVCQMQFRLKSLMFTHRNMVHA